MIQTGVTSTGSRRNARRKRSFWSGFVIRIPGGARTRARDSLLAQLVLDQPDAPRVADIDAFATRETGERGARARRIGEARPVQHPPARAVAIERHGVGVAAVEAERREQRGEARGFARVR